jgi:hypothetical protein
MEFSPIILLESKFARDQGLSTIAKDSRQEMLNNVKGALFAL